MPLTSNSCRICGETECRASFAFCVRQRFVVISSTRKPMLLTKVTLEQSRTRADGMASSAAPMRASTSGDVALSMRSERDACAAATNTACATRLRARSLFDLALERRIDTDVDAITVCDPTPTGHPIQDGILAELAKQPGPLRVRVCVERIFLNRPDLEGEVLEALKEKGIIRHETSKLLWVIDRHRFPLVNGAPQQFVTLRLARAVLHDEIPDVRDIMLVSLAHACGLLNVVLADSQIEARAEWIANLSRIETISRNVSTAIADLMADLAGGIVVVP